MTIYCVFFLILSFVTCYFDYLEDMRRSALYPYGPAAPITPLAASARFDPRIDPLGIPARAGLAYSAASRARLPV